MLYFELMIDLINRAKNILESAQNVAIFPIASFNHEAYQTSLALYYSLKKLGKNAKIINPDQYQGNLFPENPQKKFSININTQGKEIDEIFYEKQDDCIKLDFLMSSGSIEEGDIIISSKDESEFDAVITVGISRLPDLDELLEQNFKLFYEKPIINIDNSLENEKYGQVNLVKKIPLAKIAIVLLNSFDKSLKKEPETLKALYQSVIHFDSSNISQEDQEENQKLIDYLNKKITLQKSEEKKETSVNSTNSENQKKESNPERNQAEESSIIKKLKLFNKAIENLDINNKANIPIMTLKYNDFLDAKAGLNDLNLIIKDLKTSPVYKFPRFLLLWEENPNSSLTGAVLYSNMADQISKIASNYPCQQKENAVLFYRKNISIDSLKQELIKLLWMK